VSMCEYVSERVCVGVCYVFGKNIWKY
jgi:hypothetical protein